jgi:hypothetical protein
LCIPFARCVREVNLLHYAPDSLLSDRVTESDPASDADGVCAHGSVRDSSGDPPRTFQERIAMERRNGKPQT